jgi:peptidyl-prolyl cis-trans isomerase C
MNTRTRLMSTLILVILVSAPCAALSEEKAPATGDTVAVVNGTAITQQTLDVETQRMVDQMARQGRTPDETIMPQVRKEALNRAIDKELLYQDSQAKNIKISESRVAEELAAVKKQFPGDQEFQDWLMQNHMSEDDLAREISRGLALEQLIKNHVIQGVAVSNEETRAFYDQNTSMFQKPEQIQAKHILIKMEGEVTEQQRAKARGEIESVRQKALNGEDFAALATNYSEGPSSAQGGDLGYFSRGQMVKPFEDAAFALQPGEISEVVETKFGYHIIKVTDRQEASVVAYETVQPQITERLKQEKGRREFQQYIETLRGKADIKVN